MMGGAQVSNILVARWACKAETGRRSTTMASQEKIALAQSSFVAVSVERTKGVGRDQEDGRVGT
jgi:hypothetical protein